MFPKGLVISALLLALQQAPPATAPQQPAPNPATNSQTPARPAPVPGAQPARSIAPQNAQTGTQQTTRPAVGNPGLPQTTRTFVSNPATQQTVQPSAVQNPRTVTQPAARPGTQQPESEPAAGDCNGVPCDMPQPKVISVNPPATAPVWTLHERIAWAATIVLAVLGYVGVMMGLSILKKLERQTQATETAAEAARSSSQAALLNAKAIIDSERPWILVTVEPSIHDDNGFLVTATNRGRSPAQIVSTTEQVKIAADESKLPKKAEQDGREPAAPKIPIILLPGESTGLKPFSRADARGYCESDEQFARIESWEEKIYLFGRVVYRDLIAPPETQVHQTDWCCWYIHGRQKSGLVLAGPAEYNVHT